MLNNKFNNLDIIINPIKYLKIYTHIYTHARARTYKNFLKNNFFAIIAT